MSFCRHSRVNTMSNFYSNHALSFSAPINFHIHTMLFDSPMLGLTLDFARFAIRWVARPRLSFRQDLSVELMSYLCRTAQKTHTRDKFNVLLSNSLLLSILLLMRKQLNEINGNVYICIYGLMELIYKLLIVMHALSQISSSSSSRRETLASAITSKTSQKW